MRPRLEGPRLSRGMVRPHRASVARPQGSPSETVCHREPCTQNAQQARQKACKRRSAHYSSSAGEECGLASVVISLNETALFAFTPTPTPTHSAAFGRNPTVSTHPHEQMRSKLRATNVERVPSCACSAQLAAHPLLLHACTGDDSDSPKYTHDGQLLQSKSLRFLPTKLR